MKKIRTLFIQFDNELSPWQVSAFRGAVIEKVGREHLLFNNHISDGKFLYRYPVIQYKSIKRKPSILCLGEGVDEIHKLFNQSVWVINLKGEPVELKIDNLQLNNYELQVVEKSITYNLKKWLGLNQKNYKKYIDLKDEISRVEMLEKILIGNILSLAKGLGWQIEDQIKTRIKKIRKQKKINFKGVELIAFDLDFIINVSLPSYVGLGKGVSKGYGVVQPIKNMNKN